ncbi:MAG TPA: BBP7 family outer membrane beta-barrel protein [Turneriella sp.]|nr:BBP7 family outer membrane beta-barrel protein [Turneriella sp.]
MKKSTFIYAAALSMMAALPSATMAAGPEIKAGVGSVKAANDKAGFDAGIAYAFNVERFFAFVPEVNFNVGYQFTNHFKMFVGYDFLYWSKVLRAGDQIDTTVNLAGIPYAPQPGQRDADGNVIPAGANRPTVLLRETDFWAQGISLGMLWTW